MHDIGIAGASAMARCQRQPTGRHPCRSPKRTKNRPTPALRERGPHAGHVGQRGPVGRRLPGEGEHDLGLQDGCAPGTAPGHNHRSKPSQSCRDLRFGWHGHDPLAAAVAAGAALEVFAKVLEQRPPPAAPPPRKPPARGYPPAPAPQPPALRRTDASPRSAPTSDRSRRGLPHRRAPPSASSRWAQSTRVRNPRAAAPPPRTASRRSTRETAASQAATPQGSR